MTFVAGDDRAPWPAGPPGPATHRWISRQYGGGRAPTRIPALCPGSECAMFLSVPGIRRGRARLRGRRRRRNRPPETLRHQGPRRDRDLWKAGRAPLTPDRTEEVRRSTKLWPGLNLQVAATEGGQVRWAIPPTKGPDRRSRRLVENALPDDPTPEALRLTPLDSWHRARGARMVPFAGYAMPVQYRGVIAEHQHCRAQAALFDVSHMGQAMVTGASAAAALERLVPATSSASSPVGSATPCSPTKPAGSSMT